MYQISGYICTIAVDPYTLFEHISSYFEQLAVLIESILKISLYTPHVHKTLYIVYIYAHISPDAGGLFSRLHCLCAHSVVINVVPFNKSIWTEGFFKEGILYLIC